MAQLKFKLEQRTLDVILSNQDTELKEILLEGIRLLDYDPGIVNQIQQDIDLHAKKKKAYRLEEKTWYLHLTGDLPGIDKILRREIAVGDIKLLNGRPRKLDAEAALLMMLVRAYFDSVTSTVAVERIVDSKLIDSYFESRGMEMPSANTILDHINAISNATREYIFQAQLRKIMDEELDPMEIVAVDSFSISANTDWPTDSRIMMRLLRRAYRRGNRLDTIGLHGCTDAYIEKWFQALKAIDFNLNCVAGKPHSKRKMKKLYRRFLKTVDKILVRLIRHYIECLPDWEHVSLSPSRRRLLDAVTEGITQDISEVIRVYQYASDRVFRAMTLPAPEKILSLSDRCASFIQKGEREAVIGYKPQVCRSGNGIVTGCEIEQGNPKDSTRLCPVIKAHMKNTASTPVVVTVDDGYSSKGVREKLLSLGISTVSINGSKGKRITPTEQWESEAYKAARDSRSAVESMIFTLRFKFQLYRFSRRGIESVTAEFTEKCIAYNLWRMARLRKQQGLQKAA